MKTQRRTRALLVGFVIATTMLLPKLGIAGHWVYVQPEALYSNAYWDPVHVEGDPTTDSPWGSPPHENSLINDPWTLPDVPTYCATSGTAPSVSATMFGQIKRAVTWEPDTGGTLPDLPPNRLRVLCAEDILSANINGAADSLSSVTSSVVARMTTGEPPEDIPTDVVTDELSDEVRGGENYHRVLTIRSKSVGSMIWCEPDPITGKMEFISGSYHATAAAEGTPSCMLHAGVSCKFDMVPQSSLSGTGTGTGNLPWGNSGAYSPIRPRFNPGEGGARSGGDPIDLVTGEHLYLPGADLAVYNPNGMGAVYRRNFCSSRAKTGYSSPGLSPGWVDNYDVRIKQLLKGPESILRLVYPGGEEELLVSDGGGGFRVPAGAPYTVSAVLNSDAGEFEHSWDSIKITWKQGEVSWTFTPTEPEGLYVLTQITNRLQQSISISRSPSRALRNRVLSVGGLLNFSYDAGGHLSSVTDCYGRSATYTFDGANGDLVSVGQFGAVHWSYAYTKVLGFSHLTTIRFPSPTGVGLSTQTVNYDTTTGKVSSFVDANGNTSEYSCGVLIDHASVEVKNSSGGRVGLYSYVFSTASILSPPDPMGQSIECGTIYRLVSVTGPETVSYSYGDNRFPQLATAITDGNGKSVTIAYDDTGNATTVTSPRGTDTVYTYNYSGFPLGRVTSIKEGTKPTTTISYTSGGLVQSVTYPKPGTTDGSMVTASFSYDSLGNVSTVTAPGPLGDVTTTYDYGPSPKVGQPITITDSLGHATHLTYDARGNVTSATDALGNQTQFEYNVADQVLKVIHPATP